MMDSANRLTNAGSMRDAQLIETEVILPRPKRFVREVLTMPDGYNIDWYYVDTPASVMVVPVTASGSIVLVKQYRYNLKRVTIELPAGTLNKGEDPGPAAMRELEEETGFSLAGGARLRSLGRFYSLPSETNRYTYCFLAKPVVRTGPARGDTEIEKYFEMSVTEMPLSAVFEAIGETIDGMETVGALMMARRHLHA
jgi:ADP-ribose pyrophosphatase